MEGKRCEKKNFSCHQGITKLESMELSIVEECRNVINLPQVKEVVGDLVEVYVANEDS